MDDLAVLLRAPDLDGLLPMATQALQAVHTAASKRGLPLKMHAGKTELLCAIVGPGARQRKIQLADQNQCIQISLPDGLHSLRVSTHTTTWEDGFMLTPNRGMPFAIALPQHARHGDF